MSDRVLGAAVVLLLAGPLGAQPMGSAFTHQGRLTDGGSPANGAYDFRCILYDAPAGGTQIGPIVTPGDVAVTDGLFTIALNFGTTAFQGNARWLEVAVRPGASTGAYTVVGARQELRPAPNALFSAGSATADAAPWTGITGKPAGFADDVDNDSGGTVTGIATGAGLTGGPITASGTIAIASGGVTTALLADGAVTSPKIASSAVGLGQINTAQVQARIGGVCPLGSYLRGINADGSVVCSAIPNVHANTAADAGDSGSAGKFTSLALPPDGRPVISSYNEDEGRLRFTRCGNAGCTAGNSSRDVNVFLGNDVGLHTSIALGTDGFPTIAYYNATAGTLRVLKCVDLDCSSSVITTVDDPPANDVGRYTSIAIGADGLPIISYYDATVGGLKVAKCVNTACTGASTITPVHNPAADVGLFTSIVIAEGRPVISYFDSTNGALLVARCVSTSCTGTVTLTTVVPAGVVGAPSDMVLGTDNRPVISYHRSVGGVHEIRVVKCSDTACASGTTDNPVYSGSSLFLHGHSSIAIGADGLPIVAFSDAALRIAKCGDAACASGTVVSLLDGPPQASVGDYSSIAVGPDTLPVVSHYDATSKTLRVSKCGSTACN